MACNDKTIEFTGETQPLIKGITESMPGKLCCFTTGASLVLAWCVLDSWSRQLSDELFGVAKVDNPMVDMDTGELSVDVTHPFQFPLMLAFFQFVFMSILFLMLWWLTARHRSADVASVTQNIMSVRWSALVVTHVFSTFWLQALMMPTQMMGIGVFAASRALEVPAAAVMRSSSMGVGERCRQHPLATVGLMSGAAWLFTYSYMQISGCLCIWSGHGVALSGVALVSVYALLLVLSAAHAVCVEGVMVEFETTPLLMLGTMNVLASLVMVPIQIVAHMAGWEHISHALRVTAGSAEIYMLVVWLCLQMALISAVTVGLISITDAFWAVALRSLRVVYWWGSQLFVYFFLGGVLTCPHASFWTFVMLSGSFLVGGAMVLDQGGIADSGRDDACGMLGRKISSPAKNLGV